MDGIVSIQIANCRLFLSLLFGFDDEDRIKKTHEEKIVKALCSFLDNIPYDYQHKTKKQKIGHYLSVAKQLFKKLLGSNLWESGFLHTIVLQILEHNCKLFPQLVFWEKPDTK